MPRRFLTFLIASLLSVGLVACSGSDTEKSTDTVPPPDPAMTNGGDTGADTGTEPATAETHLYMDTHNVGPGKITADALAQAHAKDIEVGKKYGVTFKDVWFNAEKGVVNCLVEAPSAEAVNKTHKEAHGMVADEVIEVQAGPSAEAKGGMKLFMDTHKVGPGKLTPDALAAAHKKDLEVEGKYKVNFLKVWFNVDKGEVHCLAEAPNAEAINKTHKEAHGMVADSIVEVQEGGAE